MVARPGSGNGPRSLMVAPDDRPRLLLITWTATVVAWSGGYYNYGRGPTLKLRERKTDRETPARIYQYGADLTHARPDDHWIVMA